MLCSVNGSPEVWTRLFPAQGEGFGLGFRFGFEARVWDLGFEVKV